MTPRARAYWLAHKPEYAARQRAHRLRHHEAYLLRDKLYRETHRDKLKEYFDRNRGRDCAAPSYWYVAQLVRGVIKRRLGKEATGLKIPEGILAAKRAHLKLARKLKRKLKEKTDEVSRRHSERHEHAVRPSEQRGGGA